MNKKLLKSIAVLSLITGIGFMSLNGDTVSSAKTTTSSSRSKNVNVLNTKKVTKTNYYAKNTSGWAYSPTKYYRYFQLKEHANDTYTVDQQMTINDKGTHEIYYHVIDKYNKKVQGWVWHNYLAKGTNPSDTHVKESFNATKISSAVMKDINAKRAAKKVKVMSNNRDMALIARVRAQQLTSHFVSKGTVYASAVADTYGVATPQVEMIGKVSFTGNNTKTATKVVMDAFKKNTTTLMNGEDIHAAGIGVAIKGNTVYYALELQPEM